MWECITTCPAISPLFTSTFNPLIVGSDFLIAWATTGIYCKKSSVFLAVAVEVNQLLFRNKIRVCPGLFEKYQEKL